MGTMVLIWRKWLIFVVTSGGTRELIAYEIVLSGH